MPHTRFPHSWRVLAVSLLLAAVLLAHSATVRVQAATFTVTSTADAVDASPGDGVCATATGGCTVRAAVEEANAERSADTITVPAGRYRLILGQLSITTDMTISGAGADRTILDGNGSTRVIEVGGGVVATRIAGVRHGMAPYWQWRQAPRGRTPVSPLPADRRRGALLVRRGRSSCPFSRASPRVPQSHLPGRI